MCVLCLRKKRELRRSSTKEPYAEYMNRIFSRYHRKPQVKKRLSSLLECSARFAGCQFASQILEIGCSSVILSACCNDPRSSSGFRQTSKRSFNSDETAIVARIAVRAPLTTDDDERTTNDTRRAPIALVYSRSKHAVSPVGGYRPRGEAPAPLAKGRRVAVNSSRWPRGTE